MAAGFGTTDKNLEYIEELAAQNPKKTVVLEDVVNMLKTSFAKIPKSGDATENTGLREITFKTGTLRQLLAIAIHATGAAGNGLKESELSAVAQLITDPFAMSESVREETLKKLESPRGIEMSKGALELALMEASAARTLALNDRNFKYDVVLGAARRQMEADKKAAEEAAAIGETQNISQSFTGRAMTPVKMALKLLAEDDKAFLEAFNGPMLDSIKGIRDALEKLNAPKVSETEAAPTSAPAEQKLYTLAPYDPKAKPVPKLYFQGK